MIEPAARRGTLLHRVRGRKLHGFWYALGEYDGYNLWEAPDSGAMAAVAIAISSGGALSKFETTELLTVEETLAALGRVETVRYRPQRIDGGLR